MTPCYSHRKTVNIKSWSQHAPSVVHTAMQQTMRCSPAASPSKLRALRYQPSHPRRQWRPSSRSLRTPIDQGSRRAFELRLLEDHSSGISQIHARLDAMMGREVETYRTETNGKDAASIHTICTLEGRQARAVVEEIAQQLTDIMEDSATRIAPDCGAKHTSRNPQASTTDATQRRSTVIGWSKAESNCEDCSQVQQEPTFENTGKPAAGSAQSAS
jgi:hypothetical protein